MKLALKAFAGLLAITCVTSNGLAQTTQPKLSTKAAGDAQADAHAINQSGPKTMTAEAGQNTKGSAMLLRMPAGTYSLETHKVMTASMGAYGYQMMGESMCSSGCGSGCGMGMAQGYTTYVPAPTYYAPMQVYTPAYVVTPVPMGSGMSFGRSMGGGYGGHSGGMGSYGMGGGMYGGMGGGGGMHVRHPYYSYRHPWHTQGPNMMHRSNGSW